MAARTPPDEVVSARLVEFIHEDDISAFVALTRDLIVGSGEGASVASTRAGVISRSSAATAEKTDQLVQLLDLTCEFGQGYYFARPLPETEIDAILRSSRRMPRIA